MNGHPDLPAKPTLTRMQARTRVLVAMLVGLLGAVVAAILASPELAPLAGWDTAVIVYLIWIWASVWELDATRTARLAAYEDPTRATADLLLLSASIASLAAVGFVLVRAGHARGSTQVIWVAVGLLSVALSWALVHTVFTLRYARLYYAGQARGVSFNQEEPPAYSDFAYLAFTVGMAYQVSDTALQSNDMRRTAFRHAMLSYVFGTVVLATTINLVANLTN